MPAPALILSLAALLPPGPGIAGGCAFDAGTADPSAKPAPAAIFDDAEGLPAREMIATAGAPASISPTGGGWWLKWDLEDGRRFLALVADACTKPMIARVVGVPKAPVDPASPEGVVRTFYRWLITPPMDAGPAAPAYAPVAELLGGELLRALRAQEDYEQACARLTPRDMKPYMIEGEVFDRWIDGTHQLASTSARVDGDAARVDVELTYQDVRDVIRWTDTARLKRSGGRWTIVDVAFDEGDSVTRRLQGFASLRCGPQGTVGPAP